MYVNDFLIALLLQIARADYCFKDTINLDIKIISETMKTTLFLGNKCYIWNKIIYLNCELYYYTDIIVFIQTM